MVLMRGHNVIFFKWSNEEIFFFNGVMRKIIPKLPLLPLLIWTTARVSQTVKKVQQRSSLNLVILGTAIIRLHFSISWGCLDGAMVLGKLPVPGRPTIWMIVGQGLLRLQ